MLRQLASSATKLTLSEQVRHVAQGFAVVNTASIQDARDSRPSRSSSVAPPPGWWQTLGQSMILFYRHRQLQNIVTLEVHFHSERALVRVVEDRATSDPGAPLPNVQVRY
jgi:hypothetical protein